ncbi:hypothetical protein JHC43_20420 [Marinobacter salarius]|nr:hypothetical protein [Marinobacter salarius]MBJ7278838.1 hypothetical protein [Marinobacter salarius]
MGEVIICITAKNAAGIAISEGKPDAATKAAARAIVKSGVQRLDQATS